ADWRADVSRAEHPAPRPPATPDWVKSPAGPVVAEEVGVEVIPPLLPPSEGTCRVSIGCATSRGRVRERNEDHFLTQQLAWSAGEEVHEATLLAVADGMGGYRAGDRASGLGGSTLAAVLAPVLAGAGRHPRPPTSAAGLT